MERVHISDCKVRYRLPVSRVAEKAKLDRLMLTMLDEYLEPALDRAGISPEEEICIRDLHVPFRPRVSATDASIASLWGLAIADAVRDAASQPPHGGFVRYRSMAHALVDLAASVAVDNLDRAWAWRQLGLWTAGERPSSREAVRQLVQALLREGKLIVPVLRILANPRSVSTALASPSGSGDHHAPEQHSLWARLAPRLGGDDWSALAEVALFAAGSSVAARRAADQTSSASTARLRAEVSRILQKSQLGRVPVSTATGPPGEFLLPLAALMVLDVSPVGVTTGGGFATSLINEVARGLGAKFLAPRDAIDAIDEHGRASEASPESSGTPNGRFPPAAGPSDSSLAPGEQAKSFDAAEPAEVQPPRIESAAESEAAAASPFEMVGKRAWSDYGGLLFLACLLPELELPRRILDAEVFARRPFPWVLHQLALRLVPSLKLPPNRASTVRKRSAMEPFNTEESGGSTIQRSAASARKTRLLGGYVSPLTEPAPAGDPPNQEFEEDNPAALAFAGLPPGSEPPSAGQPSPSDEEQRELDGYVAEIVAALRESLGDSGRDDRALVEYVCARECEVVADPGWIEARFSIEDVTLDIRRAGLDLDPGYLPWLGIVLRFVYG